MSSSPNKSRQPVWRTVRSLLVAWVALLVLMLLSLASSYLNLGIGNLVAGLIIAITKTGIVMWLFMRLPSANSMARIVAVASLAWLALLMGLSQTDFSIRKNVTSPTQATEQIAPWGGTGLGG